MSTSVQCTYVQVYMCTRINVTSVQVYMCTCVHVYNYKSTCVQVYKLARTIKKTVDDAKYEQEHMWTMPNMDKNTCGR